VWTGLFSGDFSDVVVQGLLAMEKVVVAVAKAELVAGVRSVTSNRLVSEEAVVNFICGRGGTGGRVGGSGGGTVGRWGPASNESPLLLGSEGFGGSLGCGFRGDWSPTSRSLRFRMGEIEARLATTLLGLWFTVSRESSLASGGLAPPGLLVGLGLESTINSSNSESISLQSTMSGTVLIGAGSSSYPDGPWGPMKAGSSRWLRPSCRGPRLPSG
jgi:hypothetical protein